MRNERDTPVAREGERREIDIVVVGDVTSEEVVERHVQTHHYPPFVDTGAMLFLPSFFLSLFDVSFGVDVCVGLIL